MERIANIDTCIRCEPVQQTITQLTIGPCEVKAWRGGTRSISNVRRSLCDAVHPLCSKENVFPIDPEIRPDLPLVDIVGHLKVLCAPRARCAELEPLSPVKIVGEPTRECLDVVGVDLAVERKELDEVTS